MKKKTKGFTLIELLVVIAIIGLLSTLATVAVRYAMEQAKIAKAQHAVDVIYNAIVMLGNDSGEWPKHQPPDEINTTGNDEICGPDASTPPASCTNGITEGIAGIEANDTTPYPNWGGPYMSNIQPDPWGHEYFFDTNYSVNAGSEPCACGSDANLNCQNVVVIGSYGPDGLSHDVLVNGGAAVNPLEACDDVIKIIVFP